METLSSSKTQSWLSWFFRGILFIGFLFLFGRLFELQIIKGSYFQKLSEGNRIRRIPISAPRGRILARGGEVLVGNKEVKRGLEFDSSGGYVKTYDLKGKTDDEIITEYVRDYRLGSVAAHITGYLGEVDEEEVKKVNPDCTYKGVLQLGTLIGRTGLEEEYECTLSGVDGEELIEVDSSGKKIRTIGVREPIGGEDLKTSIHFGLQKKLAEAMDGKKGGAIITDAFGEILALFSSPSFDPNLFTLKDKREDLEKLLKDDGLPFFNRVISGRFHPGSVFKPVVAVAGLEEGVIDEDYRFIDEGRIELKTDYGTFVYNNWFYTQNGGVEGEIGLSRAIARSTDTFFYKLGEFLGVGSIENWAKKFSLGETVGIDLPGEVDGLIPNPAWKRRVKGERWFLGNTYHMAIGQGDIATTVIGINTSISTIVANGEICRPRVAQEPECNQIDVDKDNLQLVRDGMVEACTSGGTGYPFFDFSPQVGCKTGTAETGVGDETHAWFTLFAPADTSSNKEHEIVGTFLVEEGGEGSRVAAPIAREVFDYWFGVNKNP